MRFELTDEPDAAEQWNSYVLGLERRAAVAIGAILKNVPPDGEWQSVWSKGQHCRAIGEPVEDLLRLLKYTDSSVYGLVAEFDGIGLSGIRVLKARRFEIAGLLWLVTRQNRAPFAAWLEVADDAQSLVDYEIRFYDERVASMTSRRAVKSLYIGAPGVPPDSWNLKYRLRKQDLVAANLFPSPITDQAGAAGTQDRFPR